MRRANEHLDAIVREIQAWRARDPYSLTDTKEAEGQHRVLRVHLHEAFPPTVSPIIGDCVHNLRCALDHVVWASSITRTTGPLKDPQFIQFPVFDTHKKWDNGWRRRIGYASDAMRAEIEGLQPYKRPETFAVNPLRLLVQMDNIDKHQELHPVLMPQQQLLVLTERPHSFTFDFDQPVEDGAEIARLVFDEVPPTKMPVHWQLAFTPSLQHEPFEGHTFAPVDAVLVKLRDEVSNILDRLIPLI